MLTTDSQIRMANFFKSSPISFLSPQLWGIGRVQHSASASATQRVARMRGTAYECMHEWNSDLLSTVVMIV